MVVIHHFCLLGMLSWSCDYVCIIIDWEGRLGGKIFGCRLGHTCMDQAKQSPWILVKSQKLIFSGPAELHSVCRAWISRKYLEASWSLRFRFSHQQKYFSEKCEKLVASERTLVTQAFNKAWVRTNMTRLSFCHAQLPVHGNWLSSSFACLLGSGTLPY